MASSTFPPSFHTSCRSTTFIEAGNTGATYCTLLISWTILKQLNNMLTSHVVLYGIEIYIYWVFDCPWLDAYGLISTPDLSILLCTASRTVPSSRSGLINLYHCCSLLLLPQEDCRNCRTAWYPPAGIAFHSSITGWEVDRRDTVLVWCKIVFIGFFQLVIKCVLWWYADIWENNTCGYTGVDIELSQLVTFCKGAFIIYVTRGPGEIYWWLKKLCDPSSCSRENDVTPPSTQSESYLGPLPCRALVWDMGMME